MCRGHGGPSLAMPTKLWEVTGWETGRSFLYLQNVTGMRHGRGVVAWASTSNFRL